MDQQRRVQVVLGEAERTDGLLRFVLEAEGFDLVGLASNDEELTRVLRGARPAVVVLDGGISAVAALDARKSSGGAALVVVWPDGVSSVLAEERVEPNMAIEDLGNAVRRAADRIQQREQPIRVPEAAEVAPVGFTETVVEDWLEHPTPGRRRGRRAQLVVATATWLLIITALTAIASAVPNVVRLFSEPERRRERPVVVSPEERQAGSGASISGPAEEPGHCDEATPGSAADRSEDRGNNNPARAGGCPPERGNNRGGAASAGGQPDDPGSQANGQRNGRGSSGGSPGNGVSPGEAAQTGDDGDVEPGSGGAEAEHGNAGGGGSQQEHGRAGERA
jgi:uncharacterized membrane protein YgcG